MEISDALVQRFAKAVGNGNAQTSAPAESYVYGAVTKVSKVNNKEVYEVLLDGADEANKLNVTLSGVVAKKNDRVLVLMKNRIPQIVSNLTTKTVNADYLESGSAKFNGVVEVIYDDGYWYQETSIGNSPNCAIHMIDHSNNVASISSQSIDFQSNIYGYIDPPGEALWMGSEGLNLEDYRRGLSAYADIYAYHGASDARVKKNIEDLDWQEGNKFRPVRFTFIQEPDENVHYGFIAQEVREHIPAAVGEGKSGHLTLSYQELIAPTLALAQHNYEEIEALKQEIAELRKEVKDLVEAQNNSVSTEE